MQKRERILSADNMNILDAIQMKDPDKGEKAKRKFFEVWARYLYKGRKKLDRAVDSVFFVLLCVKCKKNNIFYNIFMAD